MTADVSPVVRMANTPEGDDGLGEKETGGGGGEKRSDIVTLDLLGGGGSKELDLDGQKRVGDISTGVAFCGNGGIYSSCSGSPSQSERRGIGEKEFITLISIPRPPDPDLRFFPPASTSEYQSVCTIDKVKFALERLKKNPDPKNNLNSSSSSMSPPTSTSTTTTTSTTTSTKHRKKRRRDPTDSSSSEDEVVADTVSVEQSLLHATCCPRCLSYVLVTKANPRCPRCESSVPFPMPKKPKTSLVPPLASSALTET